MIQDPPDVGRLAEVAGPSSVLKFSLWSGIRDQHRLSGLRDSGLLVFKILSLGINFLFWGVCFSLHYFFLFFSLSSFLFEMVERLQPSDDTVHCYSPFGRGRGVMWAHFQSSGSIGRDVGASPVLPARDKKQGSSHDPSGLPVRQISQGGPSHSMPIGEGDTLRQFSNMIYQLGSQIGESIATKLLSGGVIGNVDQSNTHSGNQVTQPDASVGALSEGAQFDVIGKSDREPVIFRGDSIDKYTVNGLS